MPLDLPPEPIKLIVPNEYKRVFYRKWNLQVLWSAIPSLIVTVLVLILIIADGVRALSFEWGHLAAISTLGLAWVYWLRKPFSYRIDKNGIGVIDCSGSTWSWRLISWKERIILSVTDSAWHELPALTIRVGSKIDSDITFHSDWQLVYRPEDRHKVRDRVIPAIEFYRAKYGHDEWIEEHGWEVYQEQPEPLVEGVN